MAEAKKNEKKKLNMIQGEWRSAWCRSAAYIYSPFQIKHLANTAESKGMITWSFTFWSLMVCSLRQKNTQIKSTDLIWHLSQDLLGKSCDIRKISFWICSNVKSSILFKVLLCSEGYIHSSSAYIQYIWINFRCYLNKHNNLTWFSWLSTSFWHNSGWIF